MTPGLELSDAAVEGVEGGGGRKSVCNRCETFQSTGARLNISAQSRQSANMR